MRPREASTSGFMSDYMGRTWQNPMDRNSRGWSFRNREGEDMPIILTDLAEMKGGGWEPHIWFKTIMSPEKKGAGMASYVLKQITDMADKHGVILKLTAKPFGGQTGALNKSKLISWYKRNGFEVRDKDFRDQLVRYPGGKKRSASARRVASLAKEAIACGKCFSWATENANGSDLVVHGNIKGLRGPHAWIERGDRVFDWQTHVLEWYFGEGLGKEEYRDTGWPKDEFYKTFKPRNLKKYKAGDAKKNDRIVPLGPWHGVPPQYMVEGLVDPVGGDDKLIGGFRSASSLRVVSRYLRGVR